MLSLIISLHVLQTLLFIYLVVKSFTFHYFSYFRHYKKFCEYKNKDKKAQCLMSKLASVLSFVSNIISLSSLILSSQKWILFKCEENKIQIAKICSTWVKLWWMRENKHYSKTSQSVSTVESVKILMVILIKIFPWWENFMFHVIFSYKSFTISIKLLRNMATNNLNLFLNFLKHKIIFFMENQQ